MKKLWDPLRHPHAGSNVGFWFTTGSAGAAPLMALTSHQTPRFMLWPSMFSRKWSSSRRSTVPRPGPGARLSPLNVTGRSAPMCMYIGCLAPWMLCPGVICTLARSRKSSSIRCRVPSGKRLPSASYGTKAWLTLGHKGARGFKVPKPSSQRSSFSTSSLLPKKRKVIDPSSDVCCKFMQTVPSAPSGPPSKDLSAAFVATWSAFRPPRLVPRTSTRSAVLASSRIHG
mmetsp:Transcript_22369/g.61999  ORF Transcript_22369/g.61999 Transcript_22369/m.61999 type:complete len:228 (-) Transcript_22369:251-934(-)